MKFASHHLEMHEFSILVRFVRPSFGICSEKKRLRNYQKIF